jgi:hypothetical protein
MYDPPLPQNLETTFRAKLLNTDNHCNQKIVVFM